MIAINNLFNVKLGDCVRLIFDEVSGKPLELYLAKCDMRAQIIQSEYTEISTDSNQELMCFKMLLYWGEGYGFQVKTVLYSMESNFGNFIE